MNISERLYKHLGVNPDKERDFAGVLMYPDGTHKIVRSNRKIGLERKLDCTVEQWRKECEETREMLKRERIIK